MNFKRSYNAYLKILSIILVLWFPTKSYERWQKLSYSQIRKSYYPNYEAVDPFNNFLLKVLTYFPFKNLLELGCGVGNRLLFLQRIYPDRNFFGFEINENAVRIGKETFTEFNVANIKINQKDITAEFTVKQPIDMVLTCATLIYISPRKIKNVFKQISILKSNYVVLLEIVPYKNEFISRRVLTQIKAFPNWIHNYEQILANYSYRLIAKQEIPKDTWSPGGEWALH
jgi:trans-aconitate methyltransferase